MVSTERPNYPETQTEIRFFSVNGLQCTSDCKLLDTRDRFITIIKFRLIFHIMFPVVHMILFSFQVLYDAD